MYVLAGVKAYSILYPLEEVHDYVADPTATSLIVNELDPAITVNQTQIGYSYWAYRSSSAWPTASFHNIFAFSNNLA